MIKLHFFIFIQTILHLQFFLKGCENMNSFSMVAKFSPSKSSSKAPILSSLPEAEESWNNLCKNKEKVLQFPELKDGYCELLLSTPEDCSSKISGLCNTLNLQDTKSDQDQLKEVAIMQIFAYIGQIYDLNLMMQQAIFSQLGKIALGARLFCSYAWDEAMDIAGDLYYLKLIEHIQNMKEDIEILQFASMQKKLGQYGLILVKDWSPTVQRKIFLVWTSCIVLYTKLDSERKSLLETQVAYISLIKKTSNLLKNEIGSAKVYQDWLYKMVKEYKDEIVNHIAYLDEESFKDFYYNFQAALPSFGITAFGDEFCYQELKNICIFWTSYMHLYIEVRSMDILEPFGVLIEELIATNAKGISKNLDSFLEVANQPSFNIQEPLVIIFVRSLSSDCDAELDLKHKCSIAVAQFEKLKKEAKNLTL
ncbi:hypothetical protein DFH28DRAFT_1060600 [Melampsora americana]|nr:hypothetical protein DFH28DRAFT_1060600 [Melampsora americana]